MATIEAKWIKKHGNVGKTSAEFRRMLDGLNTSNDRGSSSECKDCGMEFDEGDSLTPMVHTWLSGHTTAIRREASKVHTKKRTTGLEDQ